MADDHVNSGDWENATAISLSPTVGTGYDDGILDPPGDTDLFTFDAIVTGSGTIHINSTTGILAEAFVYDSSYNLLASGYATGLL